MSTYFFYPSPLLEARLAEACSSKDRAHVAAIVFETFPTCPIDKINGERRHSADRPLHRLLQKIDDKKRADAMLFFRRGSPARSIS